MRKPMRLKHALKLALCLQLAGTMLTAQATTPAAPIGSIWYSGYANTDAGYKADAYGDPSSYSVLADNWGARSNELPMSSFISIAMLPSITVSVSPLGAGAGGGFAAGATLNYHFDVSGTPGAVVPIQFSGWVSVNAGQLSNFHGLLTVSTASFNSEGQFQGDGTGVELASGGTSEQPQPTIPGLINLDVLQPSHPNGQVAPILVAGVGHGLVTGTVMATLDATGHSVGTVAMTAQVATPAGTNAFFGPVTMYIDPQLRIDSAWLLSHPDGAVLTLPDGVGNAAPVPEPAMASLWLVGLLPLLAFATRRRRIP